MKELYYLFFLLVSTAFLPSQAQVNTINGRNVAKEIEHLDDAPPSKPKVWIYTDMTDKALPGINHMGTINDPDDISAMAGYLLMANNFDTKGIVVGSTHRKEHVVTPDQSVWANTFFGTAYQKDVKQLNRNIGGYPDSISFVQSCIKESAERFDPQQKYSTLEDYSTVKALYDVAVNEEEIINVLCWGSLTEPAILVAHCLQTGQTDVLKKLRFIAVRNFQKN